LAQDQRNELKQQYKEERAAPAPNAKSLLAVGASGLAVVRLNGPQMPIKLSEGLPNQYLGVLLLHTKCLLHWSLRVGFAAYPEP